MVNLIISSGNAVRRLVTGGAAALVATMMALPASAIEYSYGEVSGSIDTIVSAGASMRTSARSCKSVGAANGGCQGVDASGLGHNLGGTTQNVSTDDGNLNYDQWDLFSGNAKATSEILANYRNFNAFVRGTAFYDPVSDNTDFRDIDHDGKSRIHHDAKLLDYFVGGSFDMGGRPVDLRLGNQVISWGESTFIQNGINVINPVDVAAIRKPGSEIKEFFIPVLAAKGSIGLPGNVSMEGFYQFKSDNIEPDTAGSFFSGADIVGPNSQPIKIGVSDPGDDDGVFNSISIARKLDLDGNFNPTFYQMTPLIQAICAAPVGAALVTACGGSAFATSLVGAEAFNGLATPVQQNHGVDTLLINTAAATIDRFGDKNADDGGEFGFALRYFSEELNQGTEFGAFFMNVHSRLPLLSISRINPATGYSVGTPGFNLNQLAARGAQPAGGTPLDNGAGGGIAGDGIIQPGEVPAGGAMTQAQAQVVFQQVAAATALNAAGAVVLAGNPALLPTTTPNPWLLPVAATGTLPGYGGLSGLFSPAVTNVGSGDVASTAFLDNQAVDAYEVAQFTCNALAAQNRLAMVAHGVGEAGGNGGALPNVADPTTTAFASLPVYGGAFAASVGGPGGVRDSVDLSLPGGYTNCNNATRLRRGFSAQIDRVLLALPVQTLNYRLEYPEDIKLFGLSANTTIGPLAVQGEVAYRHDQPLQYALGEQLRASLDGIGGTALVTGGASTVTAPLPVGFDPDGAGAAFIPCATAGGCFISDLDAVVSAGETAGHIVADLANNDGAGLNPERGRFDPLAANGRAVAATSEEIFDAAAAGTTASLAPRTLLEIGAIEGFTSYIDPFTGNPLTDQYSNIANPGAVSALGRTIGLAAAASCARDGTLLTAACATATVAIAGIPITAEQAATWNALGRIPIDPLGSNFYVLGLGPPPPLGGAVADGSTSVLSAMPNDAIFARHVDSGTPSLGGIPQGSVIDQTAFGSDGFIENPTEDVYTAQTTLTSLLYGSNPVVEFLNADSGVTVTEIGAMWLPGISTGDGFSSSNTQGLANGAAADVYKLNATLIDASKYATAFSWGAQGIFNFTYNRVFGSPINLVPQVGWKWDFGGRSPGPLGNYMAERKALSLGVGANYQNRWTGNLSWTTNFGPDAPLKDRDFAAATISYSF